MKLHIINSMESGMRVHVAGCRDIQRELRKANIHWTLDASSRRAVMEDIWADEAYNFGVDVEDPDHVANTEFLPCCASDLTGGDQQ